MPSTKDVARNPGTFPDQESNWQPFGPWSDVQPTEPHQSEAILLFIIIYLLDCFLLKEDPLIFLVILVW